MIPVDQTVFGAPHGNCFSAAVASIMELPLSEVPFFMGSDDWWPGFLAWLLPRGWVAAYIPKEDLGGLRPKGFYILSGQSPRGPHVVVAEGYQVVHDPNPKRDGLVGPTDGIFLLLKGASR